MSREQTIRDVAYAIWEAEGKPQGRDAQHWTLAEERVAASAGKEAGAKANVAKSTGAKPNGKAAAPAQAKVVSDKASETTTAKAVKSPAKAAVAKTAGAKPKPTSPKK